MKSRIDRFIRTFVAAAVGLGPAGPGGLGATRALAALAAGLAMPARAAQITPELNFQGRLTDSSGSPVTGDKAFVFELLDGSGASVWTETRTVGVLNGVFSVRLGALTQIPASAFASPGAKLKITVDGQALSPDEALAATPYAFNAERFQGKDLSLFVTMDAQGNVGIGTSSPAARLHVAGAIQAGESSSAQEIRARYFRGYDSGSVRLFTSGGSVEIYASGSNIIQIGNGGQPNAVYVDGAGRVGINQASPAAQLDVNGDARVRGNLTVDGSVSGFLNAATLDGLDSAQFLRSDQSGSLSGGLNVSGDVGIGTTSPGSRLDVAGAARIDGGDLGGLWLRSPNGAARRALTISDGGDLHFGTRNLPTDLDVRFDVAGANDAIFVRGSDGNVGIGTTSPGSLLTVRGTNPYVELQDSAANRWGLTVGAGGVNNKFQVFDIAQNKSRLLIDGAGNVGVGTTNPSYPLVVAPPAGHAQLQIKAAAGGPNSATILLDGETDTNTSQLIFQFRGTQRAFATWQDANKRLLLSTLGSPDPSQAGSIHITPGNVLGTGLAVLASGSVGIGTTGPAATLHVEGGARFKPASIGYLDVDAVGAYAVRLNNPNGDVHIRGGKVKFEYSGGAGFETMRITDAGDVGIGTTNPANLYGSQAKLNVVSTEYAIVARTEQTADGSAIRISAGSPVAQGQIEMDWFNDSTRPGGGFGAIQTGKNSGIAALALMANRVGVKTTNPGASLEINDDDGSAATSGLKFTNFSCSASERLTVGADGLLACAADQAGANVVDTLSATLQAGPDAGGLGMVNLGNVGIGTSQPGHTLSLVGPDDASNGLRIDTLGFSNVPNPGSVGAPQGLLINARGLSYRGDGSPAAKLDSNVTAGIGIAIGRADPALAVRNEAGPAAVFEKGGVGVGTTAPAAQLHMSHGANSELRLEKTGANAGSLRLYNDGGSNLNAPGNLFIRAGNALTVEAGGSTRLVVAAGGNVGIGSADPTQKLDVGFNYIKARGLMGTAQTTKLDVVDGAAYVVNGFFGANTDDGESLGSLSQRFNSLRIGTGDSSFAGNVGIGTTNPTETLEVNGNILLGNNKTFGYNGDITNYYFRGIPNGFQLNSWGVGNFTMGSGGGAWSFTNANVGIGTTAPAEKLDVAGNARVRGGLTVDGGISGAIDAATLDGLDSDLFLRADQSGELDGSLTVSGNLGIGTTDPARSLDVVGSNDGVSARFRNLPGSSALALGARASPVSGGLEFHGLFGLLQASDAASVGNFAGQPRLAIGTQGNVGVGTSDPLDLLHLLQGGPTGVRFERSGYDTYRIGSIGPGFSVHDLTDDRYDLVFDGAGNVGLGGSVGTDLAGATLVAAASGRVGIGTASPWATLHLKSDLGIYLQPSTNVGRAPLISMINPTDSSNNFRIEHSAASYGQTATVGMQVSSAYLSDIVFGDEFQQSRGYLSFQTKDVGGTLATRLHIASGGNVGIGTATPDSLLTLKTETGPVFLELQPTAHGTASQIRLGAGLAGSTKREAAMIRGFYGINSGGAGGSLTFYTKGLDENSAERMTIDQFGNVGIGTPSPSTRLQVVHGGQGAAEIYRSDTGTAGYALRVRSEQKGGDLFVVLQGDHRTSPGRLAYFYDSGSQTTADDVVIQSYGLGDHFKIIDGASAASLVVKDGGKVGIGTTSPASRLTVAGAVESTSEGFKFPDGTVQATARGVFVASWGAMYDHVNCTGAVLGEWTGAANAEQCRARCAQVSGVTCCSSHETNPSASCFATSGSPTLGNDYDSWIPATYTSGDSQWSSAVGGISFASGNVGIGTASPNSLGLGGTVLSVSGSTAQGNEGGVLILRSAASAATPSRTGTIAFEQEGAETAEIQAVYQGLGKGDLAFKTNSGGALSERMRIDRNGNVGIGTASPAGRLDVHKAGATLGLAYFRDASINAGIKLDVNDAGDSLGYGAAFRHGIRTGTGESLLFRVGANNNIVFDVNGNVGIGTTAPNAPLHIFTGATAGDKLAVSGATDGRHLAFGFETSTQIPYIRGAKDGVGPSDITINPWAGNVGIGTANPGTKLEVSDTATGGSVQITLKHTSSTGAPEYLVTNDAGKQTTMGTLGSATPGTFWGVSRASLGRLAAFGVSSLVVGTDNTAPLIFATNSSEILRMDSSGNVGIGTTDPKSKLQVNGDVSANTFGKPLLAKLNPGNATYTITIPQDNAGLLLVHAHSVGTNYDDRLYLLSTMCNNQTLSELKANTQATFIASVSLGTGCSSHPLMVTTTGSPDFLSVRYISMY